VGGCGRGAGRAARSPGVRGGKGGGRGFFSFFRQQNEKENGGKN
jgi:hypothetical protein